MSIQEPGQWTGPTGGEAEEYAEADPTRDPLEPPPPGERFPGEAGARPPEDTRDERSRRTPPGDDLPPGGRLAP